LSAARFAGLAETEARQVWQVERSRASVVAFANRKCRGDVTKGVRSLVGDSLPAEVRGIGGTADPEGIHDEEDDALHGYETKE
jgi:hypothetical protein